MTGPWFSPGSPVSSTNKTDLHDITEILLKVALNTIKQTNIFWCMSYDDYTISTAVMLDVWDIILFFGQANKLYNGFSIVIAERTRLLSGYTTVPVCFPPF